VTSYFISRAVDIGISIFFETLNKVSQVFRLCFIANNTGNGKAISIAYSVCVSLSLVIQHAMRMRRIILSSVACPMFPHHLINGKNFGEKCIEVKLGVSVFSATYV
jgi:hypothetical protein